MRKQQLHHMWAKLKPVNYWYFLTAFIVSGTITVFALRNNNLTAINLRNQVIKADQDNDNVQGALNKLRQYVYSNMNTSLSSGPNAIYPPIQLKYTYQRLLQAEQSQVDAANASLYTRAEDYCQQIIPNGFSGRYRVSCIDNYVTQNAAKVQPIPAALYEFDFQPPFWSPDLAGWGLLVTAVFLLLFVGRFALEKWLKYQLKQHN
jgi:hypothetical protein